MNFERYPAGPMSRIRNGRRDHLARLSETNVRSWADTYGALLPAAILRPFLDRVAQLRELRGELRRPDALLLVAADTCDADLRLEGPLSAGRNSPSTASG